MSSEFPSSVSPPDRDRTPLDRRRFLRVVGLGLSAGLGTSSMAFAQTSGTSATGKPAAEPPRPAPQPGAVTTPPGGATPAAPPEGPPPISEDARSLAEIVRRRYGKHLTPDQIEAVTRELDQRMQGGRRLRDAKLANGDEPDFTFRVEP